MKGSLLLQAIVKVISGVILMGVLLFVPAGTLAYPQGIRLMVLLFVPMIAAGFFMLAKDPERLQRRLKMDEQEEEQKHVILFSGLMFLAVFVTAGLNYRFQWLVALETVSYIASGVFLAAYLLYAEVLRENAWLSRTIEVEEGQKLVDTGFYGIVRHPMYSATVLLFLSMPLVLGSPVSFLISLLYLPIIRKRIINEEKVLEEGLEGYREYKTRVKYRLIPFVW